VADQLVQGLEARFIGDVERRSIALAHAVTVSGCAGAEAVEEAFHRFEALLAGGASPRADGGAPVTGDPQAGPSAPTAPPAKAEKVVAAKAEKAVKVFTVEDVRAALKAVAGSHGQPAAMQLLAQAGGGAASVSALAEADYAAVVEAAGKLTAASPFD